VGRRRADRSYISQAITFQEEQRTLPSLLELRVYGSTRRWFRWTFPPSGFAFSTLFETLLSRSGPFLFFLAENVLSRACSFESLPGLRFGEISLASRLDRAPAFFSPLRRTPTTVDPDLVRFCSLSGGFFSPRFARDVFPLRATTVYGLLG